MVYHVLQGGNLGFPLFSFQIGDEGFELDEYGDYPEELFQRNVMRMRECKEMLICRNNLYSGELWYDAGIKEFFREVYELPELKKIYIRLNDESFLQELIGDLKLIGYSDDVQVTIAAYPSLLDEKTIRRMLSTRSNSPFSQGRVIIETRPLK